MTVLACGLATTLLLFFNRYLIDHHEIWYLIYGSQRIIPTDDALNVPLAPPAGQSLTSLPMSYRPLKIGTRAFTADSNGSQTTKPNEVYICCFEWNVIDNYWTCLHTVMWPTGWTVVTLVTFLSGHPHAKFVSSNSLVYDQILAKLITFPYALCLMLISKWWWTLCL